MEDIWPIKANFYRKNRVLFHTKNPNLLSCQRFSFGIRRAQTGP